MPTPPPPAAKPSPAKRPAAKRSVGAARKHALTELRRQEILAAAIKVFSRKGFAATSVDDIAATAQIAKGTLYLYFKSKEDIYATSVRLATSRLQALSAERILAAEGVRAKLSTAIALRMDFWQEQSGLYRLLLTIGREPRHHRQTHALLRQGHASFMAILQDGAATGELPARDYTDLAWAVLDMIRGANERRLEQLSGRTPAQDATAITTLALAFLGLDCLGLQ